MTARSTAGADAIRERNRERAARAAERRARQKAQLAAKARQAYDGCSLTNEEIAERHRQMRRDFYARRGEAVPA